VSTSRFKERQAAAWSAGDYALVSAQHLSAVDALLELLALAPGERLLDVAAGTGELARRAAGRGADVTAVDLAPGMVERTLERAAAEGLALEAAVADAERLPYADGSFDVVASTFGVMFAPDPATAAAELARVCRPGGRLGLAAWLPSSGTGELYRAGAAFQRSAPAGAADPFAWGEPEFVSTLLGARFALEFHEGDAPLEAASPEALWELMAESFGPTRTLAAALDPPQRAQLRQAYLDVFRPHSDPAGAVRMPRRYVLAVGRRTPPETP
jgi:SAM-dependent methyltransferase